MGPVETGEIAATVAAMIVDAPRVPRKSRSKS
jgi:hypothetical protein